MKILIIDDDQKRINELHSCLAKHLGSADCISSVECSNDAIPLLRANYFDIVILDVVLPKRNNERPSAQNGLDLLNKISNGKRINKPERVIGITAHFDDISYFRNAFDSHCHSIIEARIGSDNWKEALIRSLDYTVSARIDRAGQESNIIALSVHGIRTFGAWQNRLKAIINSRTNSISFKAYRYGYFSIVSFVIPFFRWVQVKRLAHTLQSLIENNSKTRLIIFSHSFGTYLVASALKSLVSKGYQIPLDTLILSGSVLNSHFDWGFLLRSTDVRIVNECGDSDYILWLSQALVPSLGMAGKTGFFGISDQRILNRYFTGGHSLYFEGDDFMQKYWLPLLDKQHQPIDVDNRKSKVIENGIVDNVILKLGYIKNPAYIFLLLFVAYQLIN